MTRRREPPLRLEEIELRKVYLWKDGAGLGRKVTAVATNGRSLVKVVGMEVVRWVRPSELRLLAPRGAPSAAVRALHSARDQVEEARQLLREYPEQVMMLEGLVQQLRSATKAVSQRELQEAALWASGPPRSRRAEKVS